MTAHRVEGQWILADQALLRCQGPDAAAFLHGQLSNAVQDLPADRARPAGYCTAQGRLLASAVFWRAGDEAVDLMVSRDLAESLLRRLRMFVLRAKVTLTLDDTREILGAQGAGHVPATLHGLPAWSRVRVQDADWIVAPQATDGHPAAWCIRAGTAAMTAIDASAWHAARLASGWPCIRAATQDLFLPNALDMDLNGSIDFQKGCYPGQEVVARSHYRGTAKRRLACGTAPWPDTLPGPAAATDLMAAGDAAGRPVGRLIEAVLDQGTLTVAAEITVADWPAMHYAVGASDGPVLSLQVPSQAG